MTQYERDIIDRLQYNLATKYLVWIDGEIRLFPADKPNTWLLNKLIECVRSEGYGV